VCADQEGDYHAAGSSRRDDRGDPDRAVTGCATSSGSPGAPASAPTTSTPVLIAVPDVVGENAAVAVDELERL
jgi:hypothetical protein